MELTLEKPKTISALLVEDSRDDALLVREMLAQDYSSTVRTSHVERLADARLMVARDRFDCLLLDLSLPDADRLEALSELYPLAGDTAIVILSGLEDEHLATKAVRLGAQDYLVKGHFDGHVLSRAIQYAIERKLAEVELAQQAMSDALTGLPNRALFVDHLNQTLSRGKRHHSPVALLYVDLDGCKLINDSMGHAVGDEVLVAVGERLRQGLRESDTPARFGGDEFTVLCEFVSGGQHAACIAERVLNTLDGPVVLDEGTVSITASIGVVLVSSLHPDTDVAALMRAGDMAMYRAKERKNSYELLYYPRLAEVPDPLPTNPQTRAESERTHPNGP
jgi:two-component system cell cycle response regulator